jgi:Protease inhibitor Inh
MIHKSAAAAATLAMVVALGACQTARVGGVPPAAIPGPGATYDYPEVVEDIPPAPSGPVTSEPLAPLPGAGGMVAEAPMIPAPQSTMPQRAAVAPGGRSAVVGGWTAREATGSTCRVQLSSSPALDLYKASSAGCGNRDLARVSAWDYRDGEVYLYQPGGAVAARLRASGEGLQGALAKSGAPLSLTR